MSKKYPHISLNQLSTLQRLEAIKHQLLDTINIKKKSRSIEAVYRSKASKVYKDKLKHVFHPLKMQQRQDIINFQNYLDQYVQQTHQLKLVEQNNQPYTNETIQKMTRSDIFDVLLTLDSHQLSDLTSIKPSKQSQYSALTQIDSILEPTQKLPKLINKSHSYKSRKLQSPINISPFSSKNTLQSPKSPLKRSQLSKNNKSINDSSKPSLKKWKRSQTQAQPYFTANNIIDCLNQINNSIQDIQTFKMKKSTLKNFLTSKHTNQILTTYFDLPQTLSVQKIVLTLNTVYEATFQQKFMLAFLTYDINKDGFVCQEDLFQVSKNIDSDSPLNSDINKIIQFCKQKSYLSPIQSHLPQEFYKNPKRSTYMTLFQKSSINSSKTIKLPQILDKVQYFTIGMPKSQRQQFTYSTVQNGKKNLIKVNFQMFQQIFNGEKCQLIQNVFQLFLKDQHKQTQDIAFLRLNRKMSLQNVKFQSQSLPLRNSNRSLQGMREQFTKDVGTSNGRKLKIKGLRSNTEGTALQAYLTKKIQDQCKNDKQLSLDKIQTKKGRSSNRYDDKCSICQKEISKIAKSTRHGQNKGYMLSKDLMQKLSVFRADRSNLKFAHGVLKCQHFSYVVSTT